MTMKRLLSILLCISMMLILIPLSVTVEAADENFGEIAYSYLKYFDQNLRERTAGSDQEVAAAEYIFEQLESFGYAPEYQYFSYLQGSNTSVNSQNIIVTKPGQSEETIIVGAHYDSVATAGVDDNGSGVSVVLETVKRLYNVETPYTIIFVFFGAEEQGLRGSRAYVSNMTQEDIENTICMINIDSVLAGTYRYMYSGDATRDVNGEVIVENSWPFYQAMAISEQFDLGMRSNDTEFNFHYPSPSTGTWSDHQSFRDKGIPYLYFEASNWELPDNPKNPNGGSTGAYETETGKVRQVKGRDDLTFIENEWGSRGKDTLTAYCKLLSELLVRIVPGSTAPYMLLNVVGEYEDESELESEYDGGVVHIDVNETVTVYYEGPEGVIGVFDKNGEIVSSETVYAAGKYKTTFTVSTTGLQVFSICYDHNGQWLDTQMEAKLICGDIICTENTLKVSNITADNVTPEDKIDLEKAKTDYENALEDNGDDYTEDLKKFIEDNIKRIDDALKVICNVEEVENKIGELSETITKEDEAAIMAADEAYNALSDYEKSLVDQDAKKALDDAKKILSNVAAVEEKIGELPEIITKNDEAAIKAADEAYNALSDYEKSLVDQDAKKALDDAKKILSNVAAVENKIGELPETITKNDEAAIKAADEAYNALSDHEKSLVDEDAKKALEDAKEALAELNKPTDVTSPNTGDNSNLLLWVALLFVSGTVIFIVTLGNRKRRTATK